MHSAWTILDTLEQAEMPMKAIEVARRAGIQTKQEANRLLYALEDRGLARLDRGVPDKPTALWSAHRSP